MNFFWTAFVTSFFPSFKNFKKIFWSWLKRKDDRTGSACPIWKILLAPSWLLPFCFTDSLIGEDVSTLWAALDAIMRATKLFFILSSDEVAFGMLCNLYRMAICWKSLKVSMQSFSLQNTILQSWRSTHSFFFFWTLVVALHIVNSLMVKAAEWNEHWNGMNIEPKSAKKLNFCEGFYLITPTN